MNIKLKDDLISLSFDKGFFKSKFEEGGWEVTRIWDTFVLHEIPLYGGYGQFVGCYELHNIDELVEKIGTII